MFSGPGVPVYIFTCGSTLVFPGILLYQLGLLICRSYCIVYMYLTVLFLRHVCSCDLMV